MKILLFLLLGIFFDICDVFASSQVSGSTITNDIIKANSPGYIHTRETATKLSKGLQRVNKTAIQTNKSVTFSTIYNAQ